MCTGSTLSGEKSDTCTNLCSGTKRGKHDKHLILYVTQYVSNAVNNAILIMPIVLALTSLSTDPLFCVEFAEAASKSI